MNQAIDSSGSQVSKASAGLGATDRPSGDQTDGAGVLPFRIAVPEAALEDLKVRGAGRSSGRSTGGRHRPRAHPHHVSVTGFTVGHSLPSPRQET